MFSLYHHGPWQELSATPGLTTGWSHVAPTGSLGLEVPDWGLVECEEQRFCPTTFQGLLNFYKRFFKGSLLDGMRDKSTDLSRMSDLLPL